ncbi:MAG: hypothetical protein MZV63_30695 [Marinilabiliales bacterium]|nr:hypothetical protein [Marinilabiliales bacterium]
MTTLRAGIVIGLEGSSYGMLRSLVERLPVLFCPKDSRSLTQPVALEDVITLLRWCLEHPATANRSFDIGGSEPISFRNILRATAESLKLERIFIDIPVRLPWISKTVMCFVTREPSELVHPLVESMRHSMVAKNEEIMGIAGITATPFREMIAKTVAEERQKRSFFLHPLPLFPPSPADSHIRTQ